MLSGAKGLRVRRDYYAFMTALSFLESDTPVAVTRRGETLGVYVPTRRKRPKRTPLR